MLAISVVATISIAFRVSMFTTELAIIGGIILLGILGAAGAFSRRKWGNGLIIVTLSVVLLNFLYLLFIVNVGLIFLTGFVAALVGLVLALAEKDPRRAKRPKAREAPVLAPEAPKEPAQKTTTTKKTKKKKTTTKKAAAKKTTKKSGAKKKTSTTKKKPGRPKKKKSPEDKS